MKVTVYTTSSFFGNVIKIELTLGSIERKDYAQHNNLLLVNGVMKNKRKPSTFREQGYRPFFLVAEGWGNPEPDSMYGEVSKDIDGTTYQCSKYMSHDDRYVTDFLKSHYDKLKIVDESVDASYRGEIK